MHSSSSPAMGAAPAGTLRLTEPRLNMQNCQSVKADGLRIVQSGVKNMTIDMSAVTFMDSSGLSALVAIRKALGNSGTVRLVGLNDFVSRVLKLTTMESVFDLG